MSIFKRLSLYSLCALIYLSIPLMATVQANEPDLAVWLTEHPLVSEALRWEYKAYPNWSATQKADLYKTYQKVWRGQSLALTDPPPNMVHLADEEPVLTVLS